MFLRYPLTLALLLPGIAAAPLRAQEAAPAPSPQIVREHLADLTLLQSLVPLKLNAEQIDALLPPVRAASAAAEKLRKQDDAALLSLAAEIARGRSEALAGKPVPEGLEKKVADASQSLIQKLAEARRTALQAILTVAREKLTESQKAEIEKQSEQLFGGKRVPKKYADDPSKAPKEVVQDLALVAFIERVLLFDRVMPLLEKLRDAAEAAKP